MAKFISLLLLQLSCCALSAQHFSVANEKQNIFYLGLDNPLSIAVENLSDKKLIVKTNNGSVVKDKNGYLYRACKVGNAAIILYKKVNDKLKQVGKSEFRVRNLPAPVLWIGPFGGHRQISKVIDKVPQYVSAALEDFDFDARFQIDSFKVCLVSKDTCIYKEKRNIGGKISEDIQAIFLSLELGDNIIFKDIFAKGPDGIQIQLAPCILFVTDDKSRILSTGF